MLSFSSGLREGMPRPDWGVDVGGGWEWVIVNVLIVMVYLGHLRVTLNNVRYVLIFNEKLHKYISYFDSHTNLQ